MQAVASGRLQGWRLRAACRRNLTTVRMGSGGEAWAFGASARAADWLGEEGEAEGEAPPHRQPPPPLVPVIPVVAGDAAAAAAALEALPPGAARWAQLHGWRARKGGEVMLVPPRHDAAAAAAGAGAGGGSGLSAVLLALDSPTDVWGFAALAKLPGGGSDAGGMGSDGGDGGAPLVYALDERALAKLGDGAADAALLGFMLGCYRFDRYKSAAKEGASSGGADARPRLVPPPSADRPRIEALARAFYFARDLINTPASDLGPGDLAAEAEALAAAHPGASFTAVAGDALLGPDPAHFYPLVHAVGRASARPPVMCAIEWRPPGPARALPLLCLVGKGVCFDTGGLNLKSAAGMRTMKKDMGGAALVLALAHAVMAQQLPVALRVLVPCVENAVSGAAYRPLDVLATRAGITVEQGNCDAEGRLILADALYEAAAAAPDLVIDAATLTGAARTALGPELPAVFANDDAAWRALEEAAAAAGDPVWRLPLHRGYRRLLDSKVADMGSVAGGDAAGQAGAIVAALFLQEFVNAGAAAAAARSSSGGAEEAATAAVAPPPWLHIDTGAWAAGGMVRPGRPEGGEALTLRALDAMLRTRYGGGGGGGGGGSGGEQRE